MKTITFTLLILSVCFSLAEDRPNILWITSEDNSASWLGCYGNAHAETPAIDALAQEGFLYTKCFANAPVCAPMRSTWITGIYAVSMGTHPMRSYNEIPHDQIRLYPDSLKERGYYTGNFKKRDYNFTGRSLDCWDHEKKVDWTALKERQPFFQVVNLGHSHESRAFGDVTKTKHDPKKTKLARYHPDVDGMRENYAHYHDAMQRMDEEVAKNLKKLEELGLAESTIVVYCSDHGGVLPRSKRFLFQNSLHCPLVIRIPEKHKALWPAEKPGSKVDRLVSFIDMPKTWLSISGSEVPETMQGRVFLGPGMEKEPEYHFAFRGRMDERVDNARAVTDGRYLYIRNYMPYVPWMQHVDYLWNMKATQAWEQALKDGTANEVQARFFSPKSWTEELYDMQADPDNVNNLAQSSDHSEVMSTMRARLRKTQLEIFDSGLLPESERVRLAEEHETTIYEMVRNPEIYDVNALLNAADLALEQKVENLPTLQTMLESPDVGLRYWGIVGCFLLGDGESGEKLISDESHEVRAMAAWLLIKSGDKEKGVKVLKEMLENKSYALLTVMNIADWVGEDARPLMSEVLKLDGDESKKPGKYVARMRNRLEVVLGKTE